MVPMRLLYYFVDLFIDVFGITQPTEAGRKRAAFFILGLLILALGLAAAAFWIGHGLFK